MSRLVAALPALLTPAVIIGGMRFGWFMPTEAAIAACAWALLLGLLLYCGLSWKQFYKVTLDTIESTAAARLIVAAASLVGWVLTTTHVAEQAATALLVLTENRYVILLLINVLLLVIGCFLELIAAISILVPVLMPVIAKVGIDPVHFGVMMTLNLMIGLLQIVGRAHDHGDPALAAPAARLSDRSDGDPGTDLMAAAAGGIGKIAAGVKPTGVC
ncbi:MAG TPA: TRAP transporter large permease subunit [Dongiaceae bacterium]|jgi:tripartite ATP-independent transporter DctM subunit|nr:TRAP transporter large permease subunit [Dongiaceae bacterium]